MTTKGTTKLAVFRADASPDIGAGHVMRCLTLADTLASRGWQCAFASTPGTADTVSALKGGQHDSQEHAGFDAADALMETWPAGCDVLVVDHYQLDNHFESACRPWAKRIMVIDDLADREHDCDFLLDQTLGRRPEEYQPLVPNDCVLLLGPAYALVRPQFTKARMGALAGRRQRPEVKRILLSLGATDPRNISADVLEALSQIATTVAVDVVIGAVAPHLQQLRQIAETGDLDVTLHIDHADMASLMAAADLAIGAGGTSSWERCCLGLPSLMVVAADNQRKVTGSLVEAGAARIVGNEGTIETDAFAREFLKLTGDAEAREKMSLSAATLCDGLGQSRVSGVLDPILANDNQPIVLRPATMSDADIILRWQTDPETRRHFRNPQVPLADEHRLWMQEKLADTNCIFNVIMHARQRAGVVRLDRVKDNDLSDGSGAFEISILVDSSCHGIGIGGAALRSAIMMIPEGRFIAETLPDNTSSQALFRSAGFRQQENLFLFENKKSKSI